MISKWIDLRKSSQCVALATVLMAVATATAFANNETPEVLKGVTIVTAEKARALMASGAVMIDARVANEYAEAHVKGASNVPYKEKSAKAVNFDAAQDSFGVAKLPADKGAPIIFYCNAGECWKSYKASVSAIKAGYKTVYWFRGGLPEWKAKNLPIE